MATTRSIQVRTDIPGPRSKEILERKERVVADPLSIYLPLVIAEGDGATITDVDGNTFIDFAGGVGCMNVGHSNPRVVEAAQEQMARFTHTDFTIVPYENYVRLAERLVALAPISGELRVGFFNTGAEAVENAVKFARSYTKRPAVIGFDGGFHGRTLLALSLTSKTHPYKAGLGPFAPEIYRVPFPSDYRGPDTATALAELESAFRTRVAAEEVAAIVLEPVQGESGFIPAPPEFMRGIRRICDEHGIVLVVDEVQTGFCRTGRVFAMEHYDVEPDLMTIAKSIAAGIPLSGVIGRAEIMNAPATRPSAAPTSGTPSRSRLPMRSSTRSRRRAWPSARWRSERRFAGGWTAGASGSTSSATSAGWERCWQSSSSRTAAPRNLTPTVRLRSSKRRPRAASYSSRPASSRIASACSFRSSSRTSS